MSSQGPLWHMVRIVSAILLTVMGLVGGLLYWAAQQELTWQPAEATVIEAKVVRNNKGFPCASVSAEFQTDAGTFVGEPNIANPACRFRQQQAQALLQAYPIGKRITLYFDPEHPQRTVLERGRINFPFYAFLVAWAVFAQLLLIIWVKSRRISNS